MSFDRVRPLVAFFSFPVLAIALFGLLAAILVITLPDVRQLKGCMTASMHQVELCPGKGSYVSLSNISPYLVNAVVVSEDGGFYSHNGFDWFEIRESFSTNLKRGRLARGGSTITQQLAKNAFLDGEKSLVRKIREALLTHSIESTLSKNEILERYLNVVEFGPDIYGIKRAAAYYFDKSPAQLNILESAFLAFLLPNPKAHHRYFERGTLTDYARQRILSICLRLFRFGKIQKTDLEIANFRVLDFPWKGMPWIRTELMDAVDEVLVDEAGSADSSFPTIEQDLPDEDPDLPTLGKPTSPADGPWDEPATPVEDDAGAEPTEEYGDSLNEEPVPETEENAQ
ncbi:MAG: transglycosylase domain-containing protein [Bdellovibrionales bacterium]|nr:transglycosylase domain-containing protein [Bdellovibrionales bacterium]